MSLDITEESLSDDDIFFGKLTLKEVKKRIFWDNQQKPYALSAVNSPTKLEDPNASLRILQTHSEPNLLPTKALLCNQGSSSTLTPGWDMGEDDSFIKLENMVEKLCVSPTPAINKKTEELNNTLEVIEYILNNPPNTENTAAIKSEITHQAADPNIKTDHEVLGDYCLKKLQNISPQKTIKIEEETTFKDISPQKSMKIEKENTLKNNTPQKAIKVEKFDVKGMPDTPRNTPVKTERKHAKEAGYMTPVDTKSKPIFKTPAQPLSLKKPSVTSLKKTPCKSNAYQHISSPVASYIKNCPIAPLVKDIHPSKPLPGPSSIPKLKHSAPVKQSNKENINLPSVAYKSAKKTKLIDMPEEQRLPHSQWAKKIMTSLPRPMVIKHNHREQNLAKRQLLPQQEDSFADLSYHQAEVSVCTQKPAFKLNKNH